jgi:hypothetical protein
LSIQAAWRAGVTASARRRAASGSSTRFYANSSPWNTPIIASPVLDSSNASYKTNIQAFPNWYLDVVAFSMPIYRATGSETRYTVPTTHDSDWGPAFPNGATIPVNGTWKASLGSDGWITIVDTNGYAYWIWQYLWNSGVPRGSWGGSGQIDSSEINGWAATGSGTGCGAQPVAGVITLDDLTRGTIDHALAYSITDTSTAYKYPANKSDGGQGTASVQIPEGQRVQLDPSINVSAQSWGTMTKMVATALQTYGAYLVDSSGGSYGLYCQMDPAATLPDGTGPAWQAVGVTYDYFALTGIPMSSFRFLQNWDGS